MTGPDYDQSFGHYSYDTVPLPGGKTRDEITLWGSEQTYLLGVGNFDRLHAEGWSLTSHHVLDPNTHVIYRGDGTRLSAATLGHAVSKEDFRPITDGACAVAAGPDGSVVVAVKDYGVSGEERIVRVRPDGDVRVLWAGANTLPSVGTMCSVAVGPDGSVYSAITADSKVIRIAPDGRVETFAGTGTAGMSGEGHYAVDAQLTTPYRVAVGKDGTVYVADSNAIATGQTGTAARIVKIDRNNILTPVLRSSGVTNIDGPLSQATMSTLLASLAVTGDGSVFFVQQAIFDPNHQIQTDRTRLRRIRSSGIVETVSVANGGIDPTPTNLPTAIGASPDGALYVCDFNRLLKYHLDGVFETVTGDDSYVWGTIEPPKYQEYCRSGIAATADGNVAIADSGKTYRIASSLPGYSLNESVVPELDGSVAYVFDGRGRHLRTIDTATKTVRARFDYDPHGYLASVTDADGDVLSVRHDGSGVLTAIDAPFGQRTFLSADASGALFAVTDPAGGVINLHYKPGAILDTFIDAKAETASNTTPMGCSFAT